MLVHAWYADGLGPRDLFLGASATKSVLAHLVGRAGRWTSTRPVEAYVPELAGTGYRGVPVRDVARMTSGVDWVEDHRDPDGPATALVGAFAAGGSSRALLTRVGARYPPGTRYAYCTADSQVLDWVRERATGLAFRDALGELWRALGCTEDAMVAVDGDGVAMAGAASPPRPATGPGWACSRSTGPAGRWCSTLVESPRPVAAVPAARPPPRAPVGARSGSATTGGPSTPAGTRVAADGSRGQFVYVDRPRRTVVVKTSAWPYADAAHDAHCRDLTYRTLPAIALAATQGEVVQR